jgi:hypothetical protein
VRRGSVRVPRGSPGCEAGVQWSAARLNFQRRGSAGCGVVHQGATWLSGVRNGSFGAGGLLGQCSVRSRVRRGSVGSASGCSNN